MKCKTAVIWSLINNKKHGALEDEEFIVKALMPIVETLFPGISYFSISGFAQVMKDCAVPALKKQFPKLVTAPEETIGSKTMSKVTKALPSNGYEWQASAKWKAKFKKLLATA